MSIVIAWMSGENAPAATVERGIDDCEQPHFKIRLMSYDPFIMHIENFLTLAERAYLLDLGKSRLTPSMLVPNRGEGLSSDYRSSSTAFLPRTDPTVQCVMKRAAEIQGFLSVDRVQAPQMTYYVDKQEYKPHSDWLTGEDGQVINRESSIFAILDSDCTDCGTRFPYVEVDWSAQSAEWCKWFECQNSTLTTTPVPGSALFWRNTNIDGTGDMRTIHAGLPLSRGFKAGLNVWTRPKKR